VVKGFPDERVVAQSAVALLAAALDKYLIAPDSKALSEIKELVSKTIAAIPESPAKDYIAEEIAWRMEL
jgi:hypothetical protein